MFIGVVNKILDYLMQNTFEHLSMTTVTKWMAQKPASGHSGGARAMDYEMKEELLKPWVAVKNFFERWQMFGWRGPESRLWSALLRFLTTIAVSTSFLLLGAGMNTIGIPKGRWYPNLWPHTQGNDALMTISTPQMRIQSVNWTNYWNLGWGMVRSGPHSWEAATALASASTYEALSTLRETYQKTAGWQGQDDGSMLGTMINVKPKSTVESISSQAAFIVDMFHHLRSMGPEYAQISTGMLGRFTLTLPMLKTTCSSGVSTTDGDDINVQAPSSDPVLLVRLRSNENDAFRSTTCSTTLRQVLVSLGFWIEDDTGFHQINHGFDVPLPTPIIDLATSTVDMMILQQLGTQFSSMLPHLNGLLPGSSFAQHLILTARRLRALQPEFQTDVDSLAPVIAMTMQHLLQSPPGT